MTRRTLIIAGCLIFAVLALAIPLLMAMATNVMNVDKGSIAYELGLSDAIKAVPIVGECTPPLYDNFAATDVDPEASAVSYTSVTEPDVVQAALEEYFIAQSCTATSEGVMGEGFACPDGSEAFINVRPDQLCSFVSVVLVPAP